MARRLVPQLKGVLISHDDAPTAWRRYVWDVGSGVIRITAQKSFMGELRPSEQAAEEGVPLVNMKGEIVPLDCP